MEKGRVQFKVEEVFSISGRPGPTVAGRLISGGELRVGDRLLWTRPDGSTDELSVAAIDLFPSVDRKWSVVLTGPYAEHLFRGVLLLKAEGEPGP